MIPNIGRSASVSERCMALPILRKNLFVIFAPSATVASPMPDSSSPSGRRWGRESMTAQSTDWDSVNFSTASKPSSMLVVAMTSVRLVSTPSISAYAGTHGSEANHTAVKSGLMA